MFRRPARCQFAALCYRKHGDGLEFLLVTSRDTGRWVIPKGWPMGNRPGFGVAEQEAFEEAGVHGLVEHEPVGSFSYEKAMPEGIKLACRVQVFAIEVIHVDENFKEKHCRRLEWVSPAEAVRRVAEPELKTLIHRFEKRFLS